MVVFMEASVVVNNNNSEIIKNHESASCSSLPRLKKPIRLSFPISGEANLKLIEAPLGPVSAFDITPDGHIICFNEKNNCLVEINTETEEKSNFVIPEEYHFEFFYWSHLVMVNENILLTLLKKHSNTTYYLVSFRFDPDGKVIEEIDRHQTFIKCKGYEVNFQKLDDSFIFSIRHRKKLIKRTVRKCKSDVQYLSEQIKSHRTNKTDPDFDSEKLRLHYAASNHERPCSFSDSRSSTRVSFYGDEVDSDLFENQMDSETSIDKSNFVILKAKCNKTGLIEANVNSVNENRWEELLSKFLFKDQKQSNRSLPNEDNENISLDGCPFFCLGVPLYHNQRAYFININNPSQIFALDVNETQESGTIATLTARLVSFGKRLSSPRVYHQVNVDCSYGLPSTQTATWSKPYVTDEAAFFCVQDLDMGLQSIWKLVFASDNNERSSVRNSKPVRSKPTDQSCKTPLTKGLFAQLRRMNPVIPQETKDHINGECVQFFMEKSPENSQSGSYHAENVINETGTELKWIRILNVYCPEYFILNSGSTLRIEFNLGNIYIRGRRINEEGKASQHFFQKFSMIDVNRDCSESL